AYRDRSAALDPQAYHRPKPANGMLDPTIAVGGQIRGIWKRTFAKNSVVIASTWFAPPSPAESQAFTAAASRFGDFLEMPIEIR
ncbi:MAG TPA: crosslink repair DNA glycosylase YcaQ family protein, partial [Candidatus Acidoferrum sp.]|nr:crosslink repair DNA glycosylase YcaQ family protein [Candidatus Acidoferrum sp.]